MLSQFANVPSCEEEVLLDYAERLARYREGRRAVYIHISRLQRHNRQAHHLRVAATTFETLIKSFNGALFRVYNGDMVVVLQGAKVSEIDDCILRLRYLFSDDPLLAGHEGEGVEFCTWFDIEHDYPSFLSMAGKAVEGRKGHDEALKAAEGEPKPPEETQEALAPLDPKSLALVIEAIDHADLSTKMRRQPVCALARNAPPKILYHEVFVSIDDLRTTLLPGCDLTASRWLFNELTLYIDRCVLRALAKNDDATLSNLISVNLNIRTLTTPEFLDFDAQLGDSRRQSLIIELQLFDVMADFESFLFARELLKGRGYKLCLEGVTRLTLPYIDRESMGFDLVKLKWEDSMISQEESHRLAKLQEAVKRQSPERMIMNRCDRQAAIEFGRALNIHAFQGFMVDQLLAGPAAA